jgi:hypothetical protein
MERLRTLERLVKELSSQLEQARAAANSAAGGSSGANSTQDQDTDHQRSESPAASAANVQKQFGMLVLQDASRSRYVNSGFWSRVNDEVSQPSKVTLSS